MKTVFLSLILAFSASVNAQSGAPQGQASRTPDGHPDLSGVWLYSIDLPPAAIKRQTAGDQDQGRGFERAQAGHQAGRRCAALHRRSFLQTRVSAKVKDLFDHESKTDQVFYCGRPGIPRIGFPRKIVQLPKEIVFFYEDISGDAYRIIPTDGARIGPTRTRLTMATPSAAGRATSWWWT